VKIDASDVRRAVAAAMSTASALNLAVGDAIVLHNSNKLAVRLLPCDVFARVAHAGREVAPFEVELAQQLAEAESPVAALEPRVASRAYDRDGFVITLWTYYESATSGDVSPADYAHALERLHAGGGPSMSRVRTSRTVSRRLNNWRRAATILCLQTWTGSFSAPHCET
jgi:hypothetical protein